MGRFLKCRCFSSSQAYCHPTWGEVSTAPQQARQEPRGQSNGQPSRTRADEPEAARRHIGRTSAGAHGSYSSTGGACSAYEVKSVSTACIIFFLEKHMLQCCEIVLSMKIHVLHLGMFPVCGGIGKQSVPM